jgi:hypothetical protein
MHLILLSMSQEDVTSQSIPNNREPRVEEGGGGGGEDGEEKDQMIMHDADPSAILSFQQPLSDPVYTNISSFMFLLFIDIFKLTIRDDHLTIS